MRIHGALAGLALLVGAIGSAEAQWDWYNNSCPGWKMEASFMAMDRPGVHTGLPLIQDSITLETLFNSEQATDLNSAFGMDISLTINRGGCCAFEIESSLAQWSTSAFFPGTDLETPFLPGGDPNFIDYDYESDLFSIEVNCRREWTPGLTLLLGPRLMVLDEQVQLSSSETFTPPVPFPIFTQFTDTFISTRNTLLGGQFGAELDCLVAQPLRFHGFVKAGGYANFSTAFRRTEVTGFNPVISDQDASEGAFLGEVGGRIYYDLLPGSCAFYLGYEAMWIDNVALAPVQLFTFDNPDNDVVLGVTSFIQAAVFGFEFQH